MFIHVPGDLYVIGTYMLGVCSVTSARLYLFITIERTHFIIKLFNVFIQVTLNDKESIDTRQVKNTFESKSR